MVKIDLEGLKKSYYTGEKINATIILSKVRGLEIRGVYLELYYQRLVIIHGKTTHRYVNRVDIFNKRIDRERRFDTDSIRYDVEIQIPDDSPPSVDFDPDMRVDWILEVKIDIPYHRDVTREILLKVYNSVKPDASRIDKAIVEDPYVRLELDKNIFEYNEDITGKFTLHEIPSNLRSIAICLYTHLEIKIDQALFSRNFKSGYKITCVRLKADELEAGREYEFRLRRVRNWPATYISNRVKIVTYVLLNMDRKLMIDREIKAPITIYHGRRESYRKAVEKEGERLSILSNKIYILMKDGKARDIVDIRFELNFEYDADEIIEACENLVEKGLLDILEPGTLLKKYVIRKSR